MSTPQTWTTETTTATLISTVGYRRGLLTGREEPNDSDLLHLADEIAHRADAASAEVQRAYAAAMKRGATDPLICRA
jgi:hypothetical protein